MELVMDIVVYLGIEDQSIRIYRLRSGYNEVYWKVVKLLIIRLIWDYLVVYNDLDLVVDIEVNMEGKLVMDCKIYWVVDLIIYYKFVWKVELVMF